MILSEEKKNAKATKRNSRKHIGTWSLQKMCRGNIVLFISFCVVTTLVKVEI